MQTRTNAYRAGRQRSVGCIVLTYNEQSNLERCLSSWQNLGPICVVDSGSTDGTVAVAEKFGAVVLQHKYSGHAQQWSWALGAYPFDTRWVLLLDADFNVSEPLRERIRRDLEDLPGDVAGVYIRHVYRFAGGTIRRGGIKKYWLRLIRRGRAWPDPSDLVDFRLVVDGRTARWKEEIVEENDKDRDSSWWAAKQDKFALRFAVEEELRRERLLTWQIKRRAIRGNSDERVALARDVWMRLPLGMRPFLYFAYRYLIAGGFLDGRAGFWYHVMQGLWLRLLVDYKTYELRKVGLRAHELARILEEGWPSGDGSVETLVRALREPEKGAKQDSQDSKETSGNMLIGGSEREDA